MLRAESLEQSELTMAAYTARTYARSAQLVSNACRCAALLAGFGHGSEEAASAAAFGAHLGMAHAIMADVSEFRAAVLDADVASAALSGPPSLVALLALARQPGLADVVGRTARTQSDIQRVRRRAPQPQSLVARPRYAVHVCVSVCPSFCFATRRGVCNVRASHAVLEGSSLWRVVFGALRPSQL
jgi:geranylgeranyl pyrophosphate synthase